mmetsp:Transcript_15052/g.23289  ORF Transcript_15052/g.23289 Transcript_15052/m.23289 type:complete len:101 (-) Transcript_15052:4112-4414(-)
MMKRLQSQRNQIFFNKINEYQDKLLAQFYELDNERALEEQMQKDLKDPSQAKDVMALIESNLEEVINDSELHERIEVQAEAQREKQQADKLADSMLQFLR